MIWEVLISRFFERNNFRVVDKRHILLGTHPKHGNMGIIIYLNPKRHKFDEIAVRVHILPTVNEGKPIIDLEDAETLSLDQSSKLVKAIRYAHRIAAVPFILVDPSVPIPKY